MLLSTQGQSAGIPPAYLGSLPLVLRSVCGVLLISVLPGHGSLGVTSMFVFVQAVVLGIDRGVHVQAQLH